MNNTGRQDQETMLGPYRVLDLTDEKGLICGKTLGDLGADVIQIEPPGGSSARDLGPFYRDIPSGEESLYWFAYNANKRSITLNLESSDGQDLFRKLVAKADFVIESFAPGHLDEPRTWLLGAEPDQPPRDPDLHNPVRPDRPLSRLQDLRPGEHGAGRLRVPDRRPGPASGADRVPAGLSPCRHGRGRRDAWWLTIIDN